MSAKTASAKFPAVARKALAGKRTWVEIRKNNILHNLRAMRRAVGPAVTIMAVIKANAYGHGIREIAKIIHRFPRLMFGVDSIEEANTLVRAGFSAPIMILGMIPKHQMRDAIKSGFHISVYDVGVLKTVQNITKNISPSKIHLHVKIETGTNRLGIRLETLRSFRALPQFEGIYTHFAEAENPKSVFYKHQLALYEDACAYLLARGIVPRLRHLAATSAILQYPETYESLVRLGIGLYGLWPSEGLRKRFAGEVALLPALEWKTTVAQVKRVPRGETVGYDRTYRARKDMEIAILPVGYYDGFDRALSNRGTVLIRGKRAPIIGNVCMNISMVDVTGIHARPGDVAVLIGESGGKKITAEEIASFADTINYEIVTRINPLLPRVIV